MNHTIDFFRDEIRNGFLVSSKIKQAWASELDVLAEIDRVCEKYGIKYFAEWGTFLGTVRHSGFIPWDDDIDICMLRDDYEKFIKVAKYELPEQFEIHDYRSRKDHWLFLKRVVCNSKICFEEDYLESHNNFPWLACVDIFIKDYLYEDEEKEKRRDEEILRIIAVADGIIDGSLSEKAVQQQLQQITNTYDIEISAECEQREKAVLLYSLAEKLMTEVKADETDKVGQIFPWILKGGVKAGEPKKYYENNLRMKFENTTIPVSPFFDEMLSGRYGNWHMFYKGTAGHGYPFFEKQKKELEEVSGEWLPHFVADSSMFGRHKFDNGESLNKIADESVAGMELLLDKAQEFLAKPEGQNYIAPLTECQQLAADLGTLTEYIKGEKNAAAVHVVGALQELCDAIWSDCQNVDPEMNMIGLSSSKDALARLKLSVKNNISDRREVLFLPVGPKEWKSFEQIYNRLAKEPDIDIDVVPLPLMRKDYFGNIKMTNAEISEAVHKEEYPEEIECREWQEYDISQHCPDIVYIQYPYDAWNPCLTIPLEYYAENIRRYAGRIVYVPITQNTEYDDEQKTNETDIYNLKQILETPGAAYADEIIVRSEAEKELFAKIMTEFAGGLKNVQKELEKTLSIW